MQFNKVGSSLNQNFCFFYFLHNLTRIAKAGLQKVRIFAPSKNFQLCRNSTLSPGCSSTPAFSPGSRSS